MGDEPDLPPGPVVAFANHQSFLDGYLLWLVAARLARRPFLVWMEEVGRFPFFALQGALPFPRHEPGVRAGTIRRTRRLLRASPTPLLAYFPEGELHDADDAVRPIDQEVLARLHHTLGGPAWWPIGIHVTWRGEARPTVLLTGGAVTPAPPVDPGALLDRLRDGLRTRPPAEHVLLDGHPGAHERWNFTWAQRLFPHRPGRP